MNDFLGIIKTLIDKANFICFLLSIAAGILVFKVWTSDWLWAIFAFCMAYSCLWGIYKFGLRKYNEHCARIAREEREARKAIEEQEKEVQTRAYYSTIYESLSDEEKRGLIMLYHLPIPEGGFCNARIIEPNSEIMQLIGHTLTMAHALHNGTIQLIWRDSVLNKIINIDPVFYDVLKEKSKTFEM